MGKLGFPKNSRRVVFILARKPVLREFSSIGTAAEFQRENPTPSALLKKQDPQREKTLWYPSRDNFIRNTRQ
jgi:hypothetical protein